MSTTASPGPAGPQRRTPDDPGSLWGTPSTASGGRRDTTAVPGPWDAPLPQEEIAPTWRDLPSEPPYGPVRPARTAHIGPGDSVPAEAEPDGSSITPSQIALALGGTLLLVAIGIGAALLLLRDDTTVATADDPPPTAPAEEDGADQPLPPEDAPQGQLQPQPAPSEDGQAPDGQTPDGQGEDGQTPDGQVPDGQAPEAQVPDEPAPAVPEGQAPGAAPSAPPAASEDPIDLPRLFILRTLPSGLDEQSTTIRQTTRDDEVVVEQTTLLDGPDGEVTVRATRADDAQARFDGLVTDDAEELSVQGLPAFLIEPGRLVWLLPSDPETLMEIVAPASTRTDQLLTIGNGLELVR